MHAVIDWSRPHLPPAWPRHLLGIGEPDDLGDLAGVRRLGLGGGAVGERADAGGPTLVLADGAGGRAAVVGHMVASREGEWEAQVLYVTSE